MTERHSGTEWEEWVSCLECLSIEIALAGTAGNDDKAASVENGSDISGGGNHGTVLGILHSQPASTNATTMAGGYCAASQQYRFDIVNITDGIVVNNRSHPYRVSERRTGQNAKDHPERFSLFKTAVVHRLNGYDTAGQTCGDAAAG